MFSSSMTRTFQEVSLQGSKSGVCSVCGKKATRKQKFFQTLNPYNKTADGEVKSASMIREELYEKIDEWKKEPVMHARCEG